MGTISGRGERRATRDGRGKRTHTPAACEPDTHSRHLVAPMVPPDDPVVTAVAMLCVLREDFLLELPASSTMTTVASTRTAESFSGSTSGAIFSARLKRSARRFNRLNKEAAFRDAMSRREPEVREAFTRLKRTLNKTSQDVLAKLRNQLGGASRLGRDGGSATRVGTGHRRIP